MNSEAVEINSIGTKEIISKDYKELYMVLFPNYDANYINTKGYLFDITFPVFTLAGKNKHSEVGFDDNINDDQDFDELEFSRYGLSVSNRTKIMNSIKENNTIVSIDELDSYSFEDNLLNEICRVHFVACPSLERFNELFKSRGFYVDCTGYEDLNVNELLFKSFNNEIPFFCESIGGVKISNGVKHSKMTK